MVSEGIEVNLVFYLLSILHLVPWCALACVHPLAGLGVGWEQNVTKHYVTYSGNKSPIQKKSTGWRLRYGFRQWDAHELWARFLVVESANEDLPLQKLSPFAIQKGFQAIAGTLKNINRLRDGSFLVECGKRAQAQNLLKTSTQDVHLRTSTQDDWV